MQVGYSLLAKQIINDKQNAMKKKWKTILVGLLLTVLYACAKDSEGQQGAEDGYATGKVVNSQGKPIAGAKILLDNTMYYASYIHGTTQADGRYKIKVKDGVWRTFAYVESSYNGKTYRMELYPDKTDSFSEEGAERNFTWKLEGRMPWEAESYYGGSITLSTDFDFEDDIEDVELHFKPLGILIDGSTGSDFILQFGHQKWTNRYELMDIPIGRYSVKAVLKGSGQPRPLRIQDWYTRGSYQSEFQLDFIPKSAQGVDNSASIVIGN